LAVGLGVFAINTVLFHQFLYRKYKFIEIVAVIVSAIMLIWPLYIINIFGVLLFDMVDMAAVFQYKGKNKAII